MRALGGDRWARAVGRVFFSFFVPARLVDCQVILRRNLAVGRVLFLSLVCLVFDLFGVQFDIGVVKGGGHIDL